MTSIPTWLIGRNVTAVSIAGQTVDTTGAFTPAGTTSLVGQLDEISIDIENELENITPMDQRQKNYVITETETTITLGEILKANSVNILTALAGSFDYAYFSCTRGGQTWSFYGVIGSLGEKIAKGKSMATLTIKMVNINTANPTYP